MTKRRRLTARRGARTAEILNDGQDSFLDVVSNLVGVLIILVMVAGVRAREAVQRLTEDSVASTQALAATTSSESQDSSDMDEQERAMRVEYVQTCRALEGLQTQMRQAQREAEDYDERLGLVEQQANGAEEEYRALILASAEIDALFEAKSRQRSDAEKIVFDLQSELFEKEKKRDDLAKERDALLAARPEAITWENAPTPMAKAVKDAREVFFCIKGGRISYVPIGQFVEQLRLNFKNYRGKLKDQMIVDKIGPFENYLFKYEMEMTTERNSDGLQYALSFKYGECVPTVANLGEPVDFALENRNSAFQQRLAQTSREDSVVTLFVYPDSYAYLRDVKKALVSLGFQIAMRPLPENEPIAVSPYGMASATY